MALFTEREKYLPRPNYSCFTERENLVGGGRSDTELYRAGNPLREKESAVQGPSGRGALLWCCYSRQCLLSFEVSHQPTRPNRCGSASSTTCRSMHRAASGKFSPNKIVLKCPRNAIGLKSQIESCFQLERRRESICGFLQLSALPLSQDRGDGFDSGHPGSRQVDSPTETVTSSDKPNSFCLRLQLLNGLRVTGLPDPPPDRGNSLHAFGVRTDLRGLAASASQRTSSNAMLQLDKSAKPSIGLGAVTWA